MAIYFPRGCLNVYPSQVTVNGGLGNNFSLGVGGNQIRTISSLNKIKTINLDT